MAKRNRVAGFDTDFRRSRRSRFDDDGFDALMEEYDGLDGDGYGWDVDEDLDAASMEDLRELADELEIEDFEMLSRDELKREIRKETRAEP